MPGYADIYALSEKREETFINRFLDCFLKDRIESANEYEIPQYSDSPEITFNNAQELVRYCCINRKEEHAIYWRNEHNDFHLEIFFLEDEHMILGISTPLENKSLVESTAKKLMEFNMSTQIILTAEELPPDCSLKFKNASCDFETAISKFYL